MHSSPLTHHSSLHFRALPPLSVYVHIPWCARKCPYCDFNSHEARGAAPEERYVSALIADLEQALPEVWGRRIYTVFFGGGTPSLLSAQAIDSILAALRARLPLAGDAEITLEANPGTAEAEKFRDFRAAGVNRLSLGVQSFDSRHLKALGRIHDDEEARRAIELARAHFDNINLDLMYGLPGQSMEEARADIERALAWQPPHLSAYHLTIEPNTYFHRFPPSLPDDDTAAQIQDAAEDALRGAGYRHYETSAFAQPGKQSRHNLNYWTFGDYLGIGAGAHGKLTSAHQQQISRSWKLKHPRDYLSHAATPQRIGGTEVLNAEDASFEFMLNALRLVQGFDSGLFQQRCGLPISTIEATLNLAQEQGLLEWTTNTIRPTARGLSYLNDLMALFLTEHADAE